MTTKVVEEHPSPNLSVFIGFYFLGASIQGFLEGGMQFIGKLHNYLFYISFDLYECLSYPLLTADLHGCFIKLSIG